MMAHTLERVLISTPNADVARQVADAWTNLLDAKLQGEKKYASLSAACLSLRVGCRDLEILWPTDDASPVATHLSTIGSGPFAPGIGVTDLDGMRRHLASLDVTIADGDDHLFVSDQASGINGLRLMIVEQSVHEPIGLMKNLYEVTHLTDDADRDADAIARLLKTERNHFVSIASEQYGYKGYLTLFDPEKLDRIETIHPHDLTKTMGRFFDRFGSSLYMCYGEAEDVGAIRARLRERAPDQWTGTLDGTNPDGLFIHPKALGGVMLGISRTTHAWTWSGYPERRVPAD